MATGTRTTAAPLSSQTTSADAKLYLRLAALLSSSTHINSNFDDLTLKYLAARLSDESPYLTLGNLLGLLLVYVPAVGVSSERLSHIVGQLAARPSHTLAQLSVDQRQTIVEFLESDDHEDPLGGTGKTGAATPGAAPAANATPLLTIQSAQDLVADTRATAAQYGLYTDNHASGAPQLVFEFVQSKIRWSSSYLASLDGKFEPYFELLADYAPFEQWHRGAFKPFSYFLSNGQRAAAAGAAHYTYTDLLSMPFADQFRVLIGPVHEGNSVEMLSHVVLPFLVYSDNQFEPLVRWLFFNDNRDLNNSYRLWGLALQALQQQYPPSCGTAIVQRSYLSACYYYTIWGSSNENARVYDSMRTALRNYESDSPEGGRPSASEMAALIATEYPTYSAFLDDPATEKLYARPELLLEIIDVCEKLYPTTRLTIPEFVQLKYNAGFVQRQKEAMKIMNGVNESNWQLVLESLEFFGRTFADADTTQADSLALNRLIADRFLSANLFAVTARLFETGQLALSADDYFDCLHDKFWELFHLSTNLNEKIGKLHLAVQIVPLFDAVSAALAPERKRQVVQIKHLLKALANMKNFKIVISRGVPVTPAQILKHYSSVDSEAHSPMDLVALILEQNPKSYLAYEKLYRILNDLILAAAASESTGAAAADSSIARLQSACIESALIDNNFQFAYTKSIELFEHCAGDAEILARAWLTFYQVGKYVSPAWFEGDELADAVAKDKIDTLLKQREILALLLKVNKSSTTDNSKLILTQISRLNAEIDDWYAAESTRTLDAATNELSRGGRLGTSLSAHGANIGSLANEIVHDATHTTHQASEKLSNLFVSGLGWAIGANTQ